MPSPFGHACAGLAVAWAADITTRPRPPVGRPRGPVRQFAGGGLAIAAAVVAALPDADLLFGSHRGWSHSIGGAVIAAVLAGLVARRAGVPVARAAAIVGLAFASHPALDWLGSDRTHPQGIMALWPFDTTYYTSSVAWFPKVERRLQPLGEFITANLTALAWECALFAPVLLVLWRWRTRRPSA